MCILHEFASEAHKFVNNEVCEKCIISISHFNPAETPRMKPAAFSSASAPQICTICLFLHRGFLCVLFGVICQDFKCILEEVMYSEWVVMLMSGEGVLIVRERV